MVIPSKATLKLLKSPQLWDLQAEILTELSRRDVVQYRVSATDDSVAEKLANLEDT